MIRIVRAFEWYLKLVMTTLTKESFEFVLFFLILTFILFFLHTWCVRSAKVHLNLFGVVCPRADFRISCVASSSVVSVPSFSPSHPEVSGVSSQATWIRGPLCGISLLPFPLSVCRVCLLSFGAAFGFLEVPEEMSLWVGGLCLPFRFPLAV